MLKVNNKGTKVFIDFDTYLTPYSSVFIVNFEQVNANFVMFLNNVSINFLVIIIGLRHIFKLRGKLFSQSAFSCSKLTIETVKQGVKHFYS